MKTTIFAALFSMLTLSAFADDYTLYVQTAVAEYTYAFDDLQRITFDNGNMVIATKSGESTSVGISTISRVYFDNVATGVEKVEPTIVTADKEVYDLSGRRVSVNTELPKGIYVVKEGGKTYKIVKK
ncbi:MAG: T9SS type A sorting domain-containing protein [Paludibacteraceae bacterium]|nr:T9SS type A sorting domain-containing protein [Paludibacteraceae bacterium]